MTHAVNAFRHVMNEKNIGASAKSTASNSFHNVKMLPAVTMAVAVRAAIAAEPMATMNRNRPARPITQLSSGPIASHNTADVSVIASKFQVPCQAMNCMSVKIDTTK